MLRASLRGELDEMNSRVLDLFGCVEGNLSEMVGFLEGGGSGSGGSRDGRAERLKMRGGEIEDDCLLLQARHAPVACDLRLVRAIFAVASHAVRAGVLCEHVFRAFEFSGDGPRRRDLDEKIARMAREAREVFRGGMETFEDRDVRKARSLKEMDEVVDLLCAEVMGMAADGGGLSVSPGQISQAALVAHYLERIADHGVDIGMRTVFMVEGEGA
jgi:phosphate transport system protein